MDAAVAAKSGGVTGVVAAAAAQAGMNGGERRSRFQRICVYCGSAKGRKPSYQDAAVELGNELVRPSPPRGPSTLSSLASKKIPPLRSQKSNLFVWANHRCPVWCLVPDQNPAPCCCCCCCCHLVCLAPPLDCGSAAGRRLRVLLLLPACGGDTAAAVAHAARPVLG